MSTAFLIGNMIAVAVGVDFLSASLVQFRLDDPRIDVIVALLQKNYSIVSQDLL